MPGTGFLDALVKLASLGVSGVSIFVIFWIGWLLLHPPANPDPDRHKTLRFFMVVCVIVAVILAATGLADVKFNTEAMSNLESKNNEQADQIKKITGDFEGCKNQMVENISQHEAERTKSREVAENLSVMLELKEVAALESSAPPEYRLLIAVLKSGISRLRGPTN
jgi:hypothetical protein